MHTLRVRAIRFLGVAALCALAPLAHATPVLTGTATVTLQEIGFLDAAQTVTIGAGHEIDGNTAGNVGSILFSGEYVDFSALQIIYRMEGNGGAYVGTNPSCLPLATPTCRVWDTTTSDARFLFSGLTFDTPNTVLTGVSLLSNNVFDASVSSITTNSFVLNFGAAGVPTSGSPFGTLTMNLQVGTAAVPLPSSLFLLLSACLGLFLLLRRRACNDASF